MACDINLLSKKLNMITMKAEVLKIVEEKVGSTK